MTNQVQIPPGWPGIPPRWSSSAKEGVGTAVNPSSRIWFTVSHGILNEVYYPRIDIACMRDMGLIVTDGENFFSEEKRHTNHKIETISPGVPAYRLENNDIGGRYCIEKEIVSDPQRDALLQRIRFVPLMGRLQDFHLYALLAPHLGKEGYGNTAWVGDYKGLPMLLAEHDSYALALACSAPWVKRSVGYVGFSDGWQDISEHKKMTWEYERAENGNVALCGEIDLAVSNGSFELAVGFGTNPAEAGFRAAAALQEGFKSVCVSYIHGWKTWHQEVKSLEQGDAQAQEMFATSISVLRTHEAAGFAGGLIASLSIPWGFAKGDDDLGGYHLVWSRDLVEGAGGLLAAGATTDVKRVLYYLQTTQEAEGYWSQNMWLDGTPYWTGIQMDETAFPILLVDMARRGNALTADEVARLWPMVLRAAGFIVRNGPVTQEDRWEEDPGYSPFTLAVEISALLAAADLADLQQEPVIATYLRETADAWNASIERWVYVTGTDLAKQHGVEGYYVRIAPLDAAEASTPSLGFVPIKNRPPGESQEPAAHIVSPDALALVRFGLRGAKDPRIINTVKVIDALLKVETPFGPAWHRYNEDGYGEHADGSPFDGTGIGRLWPLLTGERAHYELAAGNRKEAERLCQTMEAFSNDGGMIPEQIWDAQDIPDRELFFGRPSGSAMPLVWAHAEHVKLKRSLQDNRVFDLPPQTVKRYLEDQTDSKFTLWRFNNKPKTMQQGKDLRIETQRPAKVHWSVDGWKTIQDSLTWDTGLSIHVVDLPVRELKAGDQLIFTFYWPGNDRWEGENYQVIVDAVN